MMNKNLGAALWLLLFILVYGNFPLFGDVNYGKVVYVTDGDTVLVRFDDGRKKYIRLFGIDSPETQHGRKFIGGQPYGVEAKDYLDGLIGRKRVSIKSYGIDRYGRVLGEIFLRDKNINELMVKEGYAYSYAVRGQKPPIYDVRAEIEAKRKGIGVWSSCVRVRPKFYRKYRLIRELFREFNKNCKTIKRVRNRKMVIFTFKTKNYDDEISGFKSYLYGIGSRFIPVPNIFELDGKMVVGFQLIGEDIKMVGKL